jgi:hypothetical protein
VCNNTQVLYQSIVLCAQKHILPSKERTERKKEAKKERIERKAAVVFKKRKKLR